MPQPSDLASQISIKINGSPAEQAVLAKLAYAAVDLRLQMPAMFTLRFNDPGLELLDRGPFDLTKEVEIGAEDQDGNAVVLMKGEVTALEPHFGESMIAELVVRGYDKTHRLYRETKSRAFLNTKDSDLAATIANGASLQTEIETTRTVYDHIFQHNQTDLELLMQRAWRIGFECFVADGKLYFRKPPTQNSGGLQLTWGNDLKVFQVRMTLAEQVDEVQVHGWDPANKQAIQGVARSGGLYPQIQESKDGATWAHSFGAGKKIIVDQVVSNQAEADQLAAARLDEISGTFIDAEGEAFRRPDLRAGQFVQINALGQRLSGAYLITSVTHIFKPDGLTNQFSVRGSRTGLLSEQLAAEDPIRRWPGVVVAIVTNAEDPQGQGRVKLKFPWMVDNAESTWARVAAPGAGPNCGLIALPAVDDEVLVAFLQGDFNQPVVIGGLWNGQDDPPEQTKNAPNNEKPQVRTWRSRTGHTICMYDNSENKIEIITANNLSIILDDTNSSVKVKTASTSVELNDNKIKVEASSDVNIKASSNLKIEASGNIDITASGQVTIRGAAINLN